MTLKESLRLQRKLFEERTKLRISKGKDYANREDCLLNFKRVAAACKLWDIDVSTSHGVIQFWAVVKFDRLCNLIKNGVVSPEHESFWDNIKDFQNYGGDLLLHTLIDEFIDEVRKEARKKTRRSK